MTPLEKSQQESIIRRISFIEIELADLEENRDLVNHNNKTAILPAAAGGPRHPGQSDGRQAGRSGGHPGRLHQYSVQVTSWILSRLFTFLGKRMFI